MNSALVILPWEEGKKIQRKWIPGFLKLRFQHGPGLPLKNELRTSLAVWWLRLRASTAGGAGSIPGWGTKILHAVWCRQKKKELNTIKKKKPTVH